MEQTIFAIGVIFVTWALFDSLKQDKKKEEKSIQETQFIKEKQSTDPLFDQAKTTLMQLGFSATEAKKELLKLPKYNNIKDYIDGVMRSVKIDKH